MNNIKVTRWFNLYYTLMLINIFNNTDYIFGKISILITLAISSFNVLNLVFNKRQLKNISMKIFFISILIFLTQVLGIFGNNNARTYTVILQFFALIAVLISSIELLDLSKVKFKYFNIVTALFIFLLYIEIICNELGIKLGILYNNNNTLALVSQMMICLNLLVYKFNKQSKKYIILFLGSLLMSNGRGALLACLVILLITMGWKIISSTRITYLTTIVLVLSSVIITTFVYPNMNKFQFFNQINQWSLDTFGKSLYSGREWIWSTIIEATEGSRILGMGTGILPTDIMQWGGSTHNQYLDILFQNGIIGLGLVFLLFIYIWSYYYKVKENKLARLGAAILVSVIVSNIFEVTLFQNNLAIAIMSWVIIGISIGG